MQFDDRLATVLRYRASGDSAARTQFRQLLDLLGNRGDGRNKSMLAAAWLRLGALGEQIAQSDRAAMIAEGGWQFDNPELTAHLAEDEPMVAAAALARANLSDEDWLTLIPQLPIRARGFLRLRRDLPDGAVGLLDRLGVSDRGLPKPVDEAERNEKQPEPASPPESEIGALVRRIEEFRQSRSPSREESDAISASAGNSRPMNDADSDDNRPRLSAFAFTCDANGRIDWAEPAIAPMVVGMRLNATTSIGGPAADNPLSAMLHRQRIRNAAVTVSGAPLVAGDWIVDAAPRFTTDNGRFFGYAGKFRRPASGANPLAKSDASDTSEADRIREVLHELRTPVNAIQGFAELIQQQLFGPTPHEYRALAATIAGDSARMLAGFQELDRMARLQSKSLDLEKGRTDIGSIVERQAAQLHDLIAPRMASLTFDPAPDDCIVPLSDAECEALVWRMLAALVGAVGAGEELALRIAKDDRWVVLSCDLPASLIAEDNVFEATVRMSSGGLSAGFFGAGFALRLARTEATVAGGDMVRIDDRLELRLPFAQSSALDRNASPA